MAFLQGLWRFGKLVPGTPARTAPRCRYTVFWQMNQELLGIWQIMLNCGTAFDGKTEKTAYFFIKALYKPKKICYNIK